VVAAVQVRGIIVTSEEKIRAYLQTINEDWTYFLEVAAEGEAGADRGGDRGQRTGEVVSIAQPKNT